MPIQVLYYDDDQTKIRLKQRVDDNGTANGPYVEYYDTGEVMEEGTNRDGIQAGPYVEYYRSGRVKEKGTKEKYRQVGPFESYYQSGELRLKCTYTGEHHPTYIGPYESRGEDGSIIKKCTYTGKEKPEYIGDFEGYMPTKYRYGSPVRDSEHYIRCTYTADGEFDGPYEERDSNGNIVKKCTYKNGRLDGEYYEKGKSETIRCTYVNGEKDGEYVRLSPDEREVWDKGQYKMGKEVGHWKEGNNEFEYVDGEKNGPYRESVYSGEFFEVGTYKDGEKDGPFEWIPRTEEGKAKGYYRKGAYKDGKLNGYFEKKDEGGVVKCTYRDGDFEGSYQQYDENGVLRVDATLSGHKDYYDPWPVNGEFTSYYANGKIEEHYTAVKGKKTGLYEKRSMDGIILVKCSYKNGEYDGIYEEYYPSGKIKEIRGYKNGKREGPSKSYAEDGRVLESANYQDDKLDGPYERRDSDGCLIKKCTYRNGYATDAYHYEYYHSDNTRGSIDEKTKMIEFDKSTEDYWGNWSSAGRAGEGFYGALSKCKDLEVLSISWTDVNAAAISHCKKLKSLTIDQKNGWGYSGYNFTGEDLRALGYMPELEKLSITAYGLTDKDMETIHQQFPRLRSLTLKYTDVTRKGAEIIDQFVSNFEISGQRMSDTITKASLEAAHREEARVMGLIGPGYQDKFRAAVARGDAKTAFDIMYYNGLMPRETEVSRSRWEREFGLTDTNPGWGRNEMYQSGIMHGLKMKDLGNGNVAFATQYESMSWHSGFGDENNDIKYSFYGSLSVVNVDEGLLASVPVSYSGLEQFDLSVSDGRVSLKGRELPIDPPLRGDLRAELRTTTDPEKRKSISEKLSAGTYKRNNAASDLISLRRERDEENSPLTTRAYKKKREERS